MELAPGYQINTFWAWEILDELGQLVDNYEGYETEEEARAAAEEAYEEHVKKGGLL